MAGKLVQVCDEDRVHIYLASNVRGRISVDPTREFIDGCQYRVHKINQQGTIVAKLSLFIAHDRDTTLNRHYAQLHAFDVQSHVQRQGYGSLIFAHIERVMREKQLYHISLEVRNGASNTGAIRFYEKHGFVRDTTPFRMGDAYIMTKVCHEQLTEKAAANVQTPMVNVVFCCDWSLRNGLVAAINSIFSFTTHPEQIRVHVLVDDDQNMQQYLDTYLRHPLARQNLQIRVLQDDYQTFILDYLAKSGDTRYTQNLMNYARFWLADAFTDVGRVIYLDVDVIVQHDIVDLWTETAANIDDDVPLAAVHINNQKLFNAGVFVTDFKYWRTHDILRSAKALMVERLTPTDGETTQLGTQPIMHTLFPKYHRLGRAWNTWNLGCVPDITEVAINKAKLLHWSGARKPWQPDGLYKRFWARYAPLQCCDTFQDCVRWRMENDRNPHLLILEDKVKSCQLAISRQVPTPAHYLQTTNVDELTVDKLPAKCMIKTNHLAGGRGLTRISPNRPRPNTETLRNTYRPLMADRWSKRVKHPRRRQWASVNVDPPAIIVEEWLTDAVYPEHDWCLDYKALVFNGKVAMIAVYDSRNGGNPLRLLYTTDWSPLPNPPDQPSLSAPIPKPECLDDLLEYASRMGRGVDFTRVDFYITPRGPVFGECACYPAGEHGMLFVPEHTAMLADMWKAARRELGQFF